MSLEFHEQQLRFDRLCRELAEAGVLEEGCPVNGKHRQTLYDDPLGPHEDGRTRKPMFMLMWNPYPNPKEEHLKLLWRKGVPADDPARAKFEQMAREFRGDVTG